MDFICGKCGKKFNCRPSRRPKFCSRTCFIRPWQERFWQYVHKTTSCWIWIGNKSLGYGLLSVGRKHGEANGFAHRLSWIIHFGEIANGLWVLHKCDNPSCVRPDHLFLGTRRDNTIDMIKKGRQLCGERNHQAKLTEKTVREIRRRYDVGVRDYTSLAERFGVSTTAVGYAARRQTWKYLK